MADHKQIVPFFYKWEGGTSNDPSDSASSYDCGVDNIHTNKGVTYSAWVGVFGENQVERFLDMTDCDWGLIFKSKYWDRVKGDEIKSQAIANVLVSWAWEARESFFRYIAERNPKNKRFLKGWLNRLADFNQKYRP